MSQLQTTNLASLISKSNPLALLGAGQHSVFLDSNKKPKAFLFDTQALWEFLCRTDEAYSEKFGQQWDDSPVSSMIDTLEENWDFEAGDKKKIKDEYQQAEKDIQEGKMINLLSYEL